MTRQDFDDLVRRIEARFAGRPAALERATAAWVALGLAGLVSWLALLLLLGAGAFAAGVVLEPAVGIWLLGVGVLLIVYGMTQAGLFLLVEVAPPDGRALRTGEAPALVGLLEALRRELQCRPFDEVRLSMNLNAGVREIPRLGLLGCPRAVLEIGLPLLMTLTPQELRAVLAHEFVHLSARHGRGGHRIYRLHRMWCNVFEPMQRPASGRLDRAVRWATARFVGWYWPRLRARSLVLSRMQESQADRVAAASAGRPTLASALWRVECVEAWLSERFWPDLHQQAGRLPEPPPDVLDRMRAGLESPPSPDDAARWTERGLSRVTGSDETHPAFPDRLRALDLPADGIRAIGFLGAGRPSSAAALLEADLEPIERELAARWQQGTLAAWRERHRREAAETRRREATGPAQHAADTVALWEMAREAADLRGLAAAEPLLRAVLEREPGHPGASVLLGHHLLGLGAVAGERLLEQVVAQEDELWMPRACEALHAHYRATGQADRLRVVRARLDRHDAEIAAAQRERATIRPHDSFLPHGLTAEPIEPLRRLLASRPDCGAAWLARKEVRYFPHRPLFVLCVRGTSSGWALGHAERDRELVRRLIPAVELPGQVLVIARRGPFRKLAAKVISVPEAEVYRRDRPDRLPTSP
jgi:Zn-dependent protease with chaperone function